MSDADIFVAYKTSDNGNALSGAGAWGTAGLQAEGAVNKEDVDGKAATSEKKHFWSDPTCTCAGPDGYGKVGTSATTPGGAGGAGGWGHTPHRFTLTVTNVTFQPDNGASVSLRAIGGIGGTGGTGGTGGGGAPGGQAGAIPDACRPGGDGSPTCQLTKGGTGGGGSNGGTGGSGGTGGTGGTITIYYHSKDPPRINPQVNGGTLGGPGGSGSPGNGGPGGANLVPPGDPPSSAPQGDNGDFGPTGTSEGNSTDGTAKFIQIKA